MTGVRSKAESAQSGASKRETRFLFVSNARREAMILFVLFASVYFKRSTLIRRALMCMQL
jgi:hypothetical protein